MTSPYPNPFVLIDGATQWVIEAFKNECSFPFISRNAHEKSVHKYNYREAMKALSQWNRFNVFSENVSPFFLGSWKLKLYFDSALEENKLFLLYLFRNCFKNYLFVLFNLCRRINSCYQSYKLVCCSMSIFCRRIVIFYSLKKIQWAFFVTG